MTIIVSIGSSVKQAEEEALLDDRGERALLRALLVRDPRP